MSSTTPNPDAARSIATTTANPNAGGGATAMTSPHPGDPGEIKGASEPARGAPATSGNATAGLEKFVDLDSRATAYAAMALDEAGRPPRAFLTEAECADLAAAEALHGIPKAVLVTADGIGGFLPPELRRTFPRRWVDAIRPGADLSAVTSRFLIWVLDDPEHGVRADATDPVALAALDVVVGAHRRLVAGEALTRAEWGAVRKASLTGIDAHVDRLAYFNGSAAETAAWPPASSANVAVDTLFQWLNGSSVVLDNEHGWSGPDYEELQRVQGKIWEETRPLREAGKPPPDLDAMVIAESPDMGRRWNVIVEARKALSGRRVGAASEYFLDLLRTAPART